MTITETPPTPTLPDDLTRRGFKLITRAPGRMFAVSTSWGCTGTKATLDEVIKEARSIAAWCEWINRKQAEQQSKA